MTEIIIKHKIEGQTVIDVIECFGYDRSYSFKFHDYWFHLYILCVCVVVESELLDVTD